METRRQALRYLPPIFYFHLVEYFSGLTIAMPMKALYLLPGLLLTALALSAQPCLPEGIAFTSQAQIDGFPTAYPGCTEIGGDVEITGADIVSLAGLASITSVGGDLLIYTNDALTSLAGLGSLTAIGGDLAIGANLNACFCPLGNATLASLEGLEQLTSIGGGLYVYKNPMLTTFTGLDNLASIGGDLSIADNTSLVSLTGLEGLHSVWGHVSIGVPSLELPHGNPALASLTGLENLSLIGESLSIIHNESLADITALHHPISIGPGLTITENAQLSECAVQAVCDYLTIPAAPTDISDNGSGCATREEVEAACTVDARESGRPLNTLLVFPNPASGAFEVQGAGGMLYLRNGMGALLQQTLLEGNTKIDVSGLPAGVYWVEVRSGEGKSVVKVVIQ